MEYLIIWVTIIENILDIYIYYIYAHICPITGKLGLRVEDMEIEFTHIWFHRVHCPTGTLETYLCFSSHSIIKLVTLALFVHLVLISSPRRKRLPRLLSSLLAASSPHLREHWSRASRGCGSVRGGLRASGVSPSLVRQCRSCCRPRRNMRPSGWLVPQCDHLIVIGISLTTVFLKSFWWAWLLYFVLAVACVWSVAGKILM